MTDYSTWTQEELDEAVQEAKADEGRDAQIAYLQSDGGKL